MNYYEEIIKHIRIFTRNSSDKESSEYEILRHLIEIIGEKKFNQSFQYWFVTDNEFHVCFYDYHKSMRQTDFFDIGEGHLDMIFWNFIHISDIPERIFKTFVEEIKENGKEND